MIHKHHSFWSLISVVSLCIKYHLMYLAQRDVCTGSHTSGIGPHSSTRHDTGGRPWCRSHRGRIRLCHYSIQEDRRCWQILYMAFQQLWAKKTPKQTTIHLLSDFPPSKIVNFSVLTWQLSQQLPWAQVDPRVNLQVAASQHLLLHSCMKCKQRKANFFLN